MKGMKGNGWDLAWRRIGLGEIAAYEVSGRSGKGKMKGSDVCKVPGTV